VLLGYFAVPHRRLIFFNMTRLATLDIGTNTALLLIADLDRHANTLTTVFNAQEIIRLGKGVDAAGNINADAVSRLIDCLKKYKALIAQYGATDVVAVGTSALRDAANRDEVIETVAQATGIRITTLSGAEEAELTFLGAVAGWQRLPDCFMVIDIGGGSTELIIGSMKGIASRISLDIGSVRISERFFTSAPPAAHELDMATQFITNVLAGELATFIEARDEVFGVAGTIVTLGQLVKGLRQFSYELHGFALHYRDVHRLVQVFARSSLQEIIELGVEVGRADVILAGTLILHQFMRLFAVKTITVSTQGLRYGVALRPHAYHRL
jgi:exopolyphosphatase/guanosine-5'-triphosphate,3'-diphosphate pyrophosphatase